MGRLIVSVHCTLDGLMERNEEWFTESPANHDAGMDQLRLAGALLQGRKTFEGLAAYWEGRADDGGFGQWQAPLPKYVATRSPPQSPTRSKALPWNGRWLEGGLAEGVAAAKERTDGNLVSYGCGDLAYALVQAGLVDELRVWFHPVVWGAGRRPFHDLGPVRIEAASTTTFDSGIVRVCGRPKA